MRYLVFGDVHGNLPALERLLEEEREAYDALISHGDVVNYGPWSNECVALLLSLNCICLKGNHEDFFLRGAYEGKNELPKAFFAVCYTQFTQQSVIAAYGTDYRIPGYYIVHTINDQYIFPDTDAGSLTLQEDTIIGHSHHQFSLPTKNFTLYNTGSVGQNRKYINVINYILVDVEAHQVQMKSLTYNVDVVINEMKRLHYPQICLDYYLRKERS